MLTPTIDPSDLAHRLRAARVGDLLPRRAVRNRTRTLDAAAFVVPGAGDLGAYERDLADWQAELAAWDGRIVRLEPDGDPRHLVVVVDRYGQVYETTSADDASHLPGGAALAEWFRFLATACPECGVIDDPRPRDFTP